MKSTKKNILSGNSGKIGSSGLYKRELNGQDIIQSCPERKGGRKVKEPRKENKSFAHAVRFASVIRHLSSIIRHPSSIIHHPSSIILH